MMKKRYPFLAIMASLPLMITLPAQAKCKLGDDLYGTNNSSIQIPFGKVSLYGNVLQPPGSLLGSVAVPPTNYTKGTAESVLWTCDEADLPGLYYLVAVNGDDLAGGMDDIGKDDGLEGVRSTYIRYVGLRLTMSGVVIERRWKVVPLNGHTLTDGKVQIKLKDIPTVSAELYKVSTKVNGLNFLYNLCGATKVAKAKGTNYDCGQPNAYIQLVGPGLSNDKEGQDSKFNFNFWTGVGRANGLGYGMRDINTFYELPTCVARSATPVVTLPAIKKSQLENGETVSAPFNVTVECSDSATSGVSTNQTALGFQVSPGAYTAAQKLGMVNDKNAVSMLLSDNYNDAGIAKGVGITIAYSNAPGTPLNLVGQGDLNVLTETGPEAGWYPVLDNATATGSSNSGYTNYSYDFIATLKPISGQSITAGKVKATATVQVKIQ